MAENTVGSGARTVVFKDAIVSHETHEIQVLFHWGVIPIALLPTFNV